MRRFLRDHDGAILVEATVMMTIIFTFVLGGIDFLLAFYQWNASVKAVEIGARIAAVSNPVAAGLDALSGTPGGTAPSFVVTCDGSTTPMCACTSGSCSGISDNVAAMNTIVLGRGNNGTCNVASVVYMAGMCSVFPAIAVKNVRIVYTRTANGTDPGLGYAGRPSGPVPTITVSLQNIPFQFYFLGGLLHFANINIPPLTTSITGEDLCSTTAAVPAGSDPCASD